MLKYAAVVIICLALFTSCSGDREYHRNLQSVVEVERAFARVSADSGMQSAFLSFLAEDAIVFRPDPAPGREYYRSSPNIPGMLVWQPAYADVSGDGSMGYTTGPWEFRKAGRGDTVAVFGHYVSVWKRQADNTWKVVIDVGIPHPHPGYDLTDTMLSVTSLRDDGEKLSEKTEVADIFPLVETEQQFSQMARETDWREAFRAFTSLSVRLYRVNRFPMSGMESAVEALPSATPAEWTVMGSDTSRSGDLGYTYGYIEEIPGPEKSSYLRIWKRKAGGQWKMVLEVTNSIQGEI